MQKREPWERSWLFTWYIYRAPADKSTKAAWVVIYVHLKFAFSFSNNRFFFQNNFTELAESNVVYKQRRNSSAILKQKFSPCPDSIKSSSRQNLVKDQHTPTTPFIDTHLHMTSCNQGSFSKQEREPWERG